LIAANHPARRKECVTGETWIPSEEETGFDDSRGTSHFSGKTRRGKGVFPVRLTWRVILRGKASGRKNEVKPGRAPWFLRWGTG